MENNTALAVIDATETAIAVIEPTEIVVASAKKVLDFTIVHGYLRGDHRCPFELHATGCRDLRGKLAQKLFSYNIYAESRELALADAEAEHGAGQVWVQPCCLLKRMQAIGRA